MATQVYSIRALTNLHVGSGAAGYGIVDKLVQRDPTTDLPTIHATGIKGALRQYFEENDMAEIRGIFGSGVSDAARDVQQGKVRFINADLLAFPVPYEGTEARKPFSLVTTNDVVDAFDEKVSCFTEWDDWARTQVRDNGWESNMKKFTDGAKELPVIARNYLNDGISENLWYEELVPREAVFGTIMQGPDRYMMAMSEALDGRIVQLGANATVGYGYCLFTLIN